MCRLQRFWVDHIYRGFIWVCESGRDTVGRISATPFFVVGHGQTPPDFEKVIRFMDVLSTTVFTWVHMKWNKVFLEIKFLRCPRALDLYVPRIRRVVASGLSSVFPIITLFALPLSYRFFLSHFLSFSEDQILTRNWNNLVRPQVRFVKTTMGWGFGKACLFAQNSLHTIVMGHRHKECN